MDGRDCHDGNKYRPDNVNEEQNHDKEVSCADSDYSSGVVWELLLEPWVEYEPPNAAETACKQNNNYPSDDSSNHDVLCRAELLFW